MSRFALYLVLLLLTACSTQQVLIPAKVNLREVNESISVNVQGPASEAALLDRLTREIKAALIVAGFDIEKQTGEKLVLNVNVSEFDPGDAAARFIVGFGAGRGSLIYSAEYKDAAGQILAKIEDKSVSRAGRFTSTATMDILRPWR